MDATTIVLVLVGAAAALLVGLKIRKGLKSGACDSCCGKCSESCKK